MGRSSQKKKKEDGEDRTRRTGEEEETVGGEGESVEKGGESETQTGRDKALEKGKEDVLKLLRGKRSQEVKEKEGKRKSEENGNGAGGRVVSRGGRIRGEEENRKRVIMLPSSLFPVSLERALLIGR